MKTILNLAEKYSFNFKTKKNLKINIFKICKFLNQ